jgi:hypothetical protein
MSPTMLATLRRIERDTRQLARPSCHWPSMAAAGCTCNDTARYPRDYYRPAELAWRWRGVGRFAS